MINDILRRSTAHDGVRMSATLTRKWERVRRALYKYFESPPLKRRDDSARWLVMAIFNFLHSLPYDDIIRGNYLSDYNIRRIRESLSSRERVIADHIAGMTDSYALDQYWRKYFAPEVWDPWL